MYHKFRKLNCCAKICKYFVQYSGLVESDPSWFSADRSSFSRSFSILYKSIYVIAMQDRFYISLPPRLIFIQNILIMYFILIVKKYELSDSLLEQMASLVFIQPQGGWLPDGVIHTYKCLLLWVNIVDHFYWYVPVDTVCRIGFLWSV